MGFVEGTGIGIFLKNYANSKKSLLFKADSFPFVMEVIRKNP